MTKSNPLSQNGFMTGLITGTVLSGLGLYLLGTKQGRELLLELVELAEALEKTQNLSDDHKEHKQSPLLTADGKSIKNVLDKLQAIIPDKENFEKYFARDGKILK